MGIGRKLEIMLLTAAALALSFGSALADYTITDLGTGLASGLFSTINNNGDIVGRAMFSTSTPYHAALWSNGVVTDLGALAPNEESNAHYITDSGLIVGESYSGTTGTTNLYRQAAIFSVGSAPINIHNNLTFNANNSYASWAGNGLILGQAYDDLISTNHAVIWTDGTAGSAIDKNPSWSESSGLRRINSSGQMVGYATPSDIGYARATLWDIDGSVKYLDTTGWQRSYASGINDAGQILVEFSSGVHQSFGLWDGTDGTAGLQMFSNPYGWEGAGASSMNNHGQIVGAARTTDPTTGSGVSHAFLWDNGTAIDLEALLGGTEWHLEGAYSINEKGQIVVGAKRADGALTTLLLTPDAVPTPIPAALPLFGSGLAFLGFLRRRLSRA